MSGGEVKKYFSRKNNVSIWWSPENDEKNHIYKRQEDIIHSIVNKRKIKRILDLSAGKGRFARRLAKGRKYTCLDISQQMLDCIKKQNLGVNLIRADSENVPLRKKFDCIICAESLVHYPTQVEALKEMKRLLGRNGIVIITTDNRDCLNKIVRRIENLFNRIRGKPTKTIGNKIFFPRSHREYKQLFKDSGLKINSKINLSVLTTPVKFYSNNKYLISPELSRKFKFLDSLLLEKVPLTKSISSYFIYILEHEK